MSSSRHRHSYSTLVGGRLVWIDSGVPPPSVRLRTRLETDDEMRRRLLDAKPDAPSYIVHRILTTHDAALDRLIASYDLEPRRLVEESA